MWGESSTRTGTKCGEGRGSPARELGLNVERGGSVQYTGNLACVVAYYWDGLRLPNSTSCHFNPDNLQQLKVTFRRQWRCSVYLEARSS